MAARRGKALVLLFAMVALLSVWLAKPAIRNGVSAHPAGGSAPGIGTPPQAACGVWTRVPGADPSGAAEDGLNGVAAISPDDVWGVGSWSTAFIGPSNPLIEHWDGANWSIVPSPTPSSAHGTGLTSVAAISTNDVWAVGAYGNTMQNAVETLVEHWNGTSWTILSSPNPSTASHSSLSSVAADAPNDVWAVGDFLESTLGPYQTLVEHFDGAHWTIVPSPNVSGSSGPVDNYFYGVSALSSTNVWAVGSEGPSGSSQSGTLIEHWDGVSWNIVASPNSSLVNNQLNAVTALSATNVWAVGFSADSTKNGTRQPLAEHFNGITWSVVPMSSPYPTWTDPQALARVPHSNHLWTAGEMFAGSDQITFTSRWNGTNWVPVLSASGPSSGPSAANLVYGLSMDSANDGWAVGTYDPGLPPSASRFWHKPHRAPSNASPNTGVPGNAILIIHYHVLFTGRPCTPGQNGCVCG
jgi:hypothetical protein